MPDSPSPANRHDVATAIQVKFRCQESLKLQVDAAARENEVSISAEISQRLASSFLKDQQSILESAFLGGSANACVVRGISALMLIGAHHGAWEQDAVRRTALRGAIHRLLEEIMPVPDLYNWDGTEGSPVPDEILHQIELQTKALYPVVDLYLANVRPMRSNDDKPGGP